MNTTNEYLRLLAADLAMINRGKAAELQSFLHTVSEPCNLSSTSATCHVHCLTLDGNGRPRTSAFIQHMISNAIDYAIPRSKINAAFEEQRNTGSSSKVFKLLVEALGLFTELSTSGEGGEILLFLLAEKFLGLPQIISKMHLKTSTQMHYHGADGVHVGVSPNTGKLRLYWGESKLYSDISGGIRSCMNSIAPLLLGTGGIGSPETRDLQLLQSYMDLDDPKLTQAVKNYLDPDSPLFCSVEFSGICLVGYDSEVYPTTPNNIIIEQVVDLVTKDIPKLHEKVISNLLSKEIHSFHMHVFCIPFPSVEGFRTEFLKSLKLGG